MNMMPAVGFYWRRHAQIAAMTAGGGEAGKVALEFARALAPVVKARWPALNKDGILDDALSTLEAMMAETQAGDHFPGYPDPKER